jgi:hypothetical protein
VTEVSDASKELEGTVGRLREGVEAFDLGAEAGSLQKSAPKPASQEPAPREYGGDGRSEPPSNSAHTNGSQANGSRSTN